MTLDETWAAILAEVAERTRAEICGVIATTITTQAPRLGVRREATRQLLEAIARDVERHLDKFTTEIARDAFGDLTPDEETAA